MKIPVGRKANGISMGYNEMVCRWVQKSKNKNPILFYQTFREFQRVARLFSEKNRKKSKILLPGRLGEF